MAERILNGTFQRAGYFRDRIFRNIGCGAFCRLCGRICKKTHGSIGHFIGLTVKPLCLQIGQSGSNVKDFYRKAVSLI
jgi:hypothetical protein